MILNSSFALYSCACTANLYSCPVARLEHNFDIRTPYAAPGAFPDGVNHVPGGSTETEGRHCVLLLLRKPQPLRGSVGALLSVTYCSAFLLEGPIQS